jgi:predicted flap endonuclease-1-like 5' DNA nuclease
MITDLGEIWIMLAVPFVVGCLLGSLLYRQLSFTRLAPVQNAIVADVSGFFGGMRRAIFGSGRRRRPARSVAPTPAVAVPETARAAPAPARSAPPSAKPVVQSAPPPRQTAASLPAATPARAAPEAPRPAEPAAAKPVAPPPPPKRPVTPPPALPVEAVSYDVRPPTPEEVRDGRPPAMLAPRYGEGDDLRRIRGIGESYEARLHGLGIFHYEQIAAWSLVEAAWVAMHTGAGDRVVRYDWIGQARALAGMDGAPPEEE